MARDPLADPAPLIRRVYAYVAYRVGDGAEAEDITSETFERALRYRESYDSRKGHAGDVAHRDRDPLRGRLGHPARRRGARLRGSRAVGRRRRGRRRRERLDLAAAVSGLPERDRELVALRYGADLKAREIAERARDEDGRGRGRAPSRARAAARRGGGARRHSGAGVGELAP